MAICTLLECAHCLRILTTFWLSLKSAIVRASDIRVIMELLNEILHLALSRSLRLRQRVNDSTIIYNIG